MVGNTGETINFDSKPPGFTVEAVSGGRFLNSTLCGHGCRVFTGRFGVRRPWKRQDELE